MSNNAVERPIAVIDFSNNLIRLHKKTIEAIGSPENILLIINPEKLTFGIVACEKKINGSHRIRFRKTHCCELYSKSLVSTIKRQGYMPATQARRYFGRASVSLKTEIYRLICSVI